MAFVPVTDQWWSWVLSAVGIAGFFLAGSKVWWAWYVNLANQVLWTAYAFLTEQWGFLVGTLFYFWVFSRNAYLWTKEHRDKKKAQSTFIEPAFIPKQGDQPKGGAGDSGASRR